MSRIPAHRRSVRALLLAAVMAVTLSACGFSAQTLQPYTPAEGVNLDVAGIKVRNVLVVADESGNGILSGSIVSSSSDTLTAVQVVPVVTGDTPAAPLTVTSLRPVALPTNQLVVLTDPSPAYAVSGDTLVVGETVTLSLTFASGSTASVITPVMSSSDIAFAELASSIPTAGAQPTP